MGVQRAGLLSGISLCHLPCPQGPGEPRGRLASVPAPLKRGPQHLPRRPLSASGAQRVRCQARSGRTRPPPRVIAVVGPTMPTKGLTLPEPRAPSQWVLSQTVLGPQRGCGRPQLAQGGICRALSASPSNTGPKGRDFCARVAPVFRGSPGQSGGVRGLAVGREAVASPGLSLLICVVSGGNSNPHPGWAHAQGSGTANTQRSRHFALRKELSWAKENCRRHPNLSTWRRTRSAPLPGSACDHGRAPLVCSGQRSWSQESQAVLTSPSSTTRRLGSAGTISHTAHLWLLQQGDSG